jgi:hypothetical protein
MSPKKKSRTKAQKKAEAKLLKLLANPTERERRIRNFNANPRLFLAAVEADEDEVVAGFLVELIIPAIFTAFTSGIGVALIGLASGILTALLTPQPEKPRERAEDPKFAPKFATGEALGSIARFGQTIPAIFCSRSLDPTGGYTTGGNLINSRVTTRNGNQTTYGLYSIGHGVIGNVDIAKTLINDQPYEAADPTIQIGWLPGADNDPPLADFPHLSQNMPVRTTGLAGVNLSSLDARVSPAIPVTPVGAFILGAEYRVGSPGGTVIAVVAIQGSTITPSLNLSGLPAGTNFYLNVAGNPFVGTSTAVPAAGGSNTFSILEADLENYNIGSEYVAFNGTTKTRFRVISRTFVAGSGGFWVLTTTPSLLPGSNVIYSYVESRYRTTRRVNQLDLNFAASIWARNKDGTLINFAQLYTLKMKRYNDATFVPICRFFITGKNTAQVYRGIEIYDLPLNTYDIKIEPEVTVPAPLGLPTYELDDDGPIVSANTGINVGGGAVPKLRLQGNLYTGGTALDVNLNQNTNDAPQRSTQNGASLRIQHVNEIEYANTVVKARNMGYPGIAKVWVKQSATIDRAGRLDFLFFVSEGIIVDSLLAAGSAGAASAGAVLSNLLPHGLVMAPGLTLRNASQRKSAAIVSIAANTITTATSLTWEQDDKWYVHGRRSSCWWPEIKAWLLKDRRFGATDSIIADFDLNYPSMVRAVKWLGGANQFNQKIAWHGAITARSNIARLDAENALKVLLFPVDEDGGKGYWPMSTPPVGGIFNLANADNFRIEETTIQQTRPTHCTVSYSEQQEFYNTANELRYAIQTVTASIHGKPNTNELAIDNPECTSRLQAILVSKVRLNQGRYFGQTIASLDAKKIEAFGMRLGSLMRVQLVSSDTKGEQNGFVLERLANGEFRLDNEFQLVRSLTTGANTDIHIDFLKAGVAVGDLVRNEENGVVSPITAVSQHGFVAAPPVPIDTYYQIGDLTNSNVLAWTDQAGAIGPYLFTTTFHDGHLWMLIAGVTLDVGTAVAIGSNAIKERFFQCLSIGLRLGDASALGQSSIPIGGTGFHSRMFDFADVQVQTIDNIINPG